MKAKAYKTIKFPTESEYKEKKSLFIAKAYNVSSQPDAEAILSVLIKKYYDASHHCYAYMLHDGKVKFSDAGEPHGTAGIRILNAIQHFKLQNCLVVVVRYYGGTKLGVGPLGKAYYSAAINCLTKAEIIIKQPFYQTEIFVELSVSNKLISYLHKKKITIANIEYDPVLKVRCLIPADNYTIFELKLMELYSNIISIKKDENFIFE